MPKIHVELTDQTFEALVKFAARERRPIPWQAEIMIVRALGEFLPITPAASTDRASSEQPQEAASVSA